MEGFIPRKVRAAWFSTLVFLCFSYLLVLFEGFSESSGVILIVTLIVLFIGNFVYMIPVSLFSDTLTNKMEHYRFVCSAFIHIFFAVLTMFLIKGFALFSIICTVLFFMSDEWQKQKKNDSNNKLTINGAALLFLIAIGFYCVEMFTGYGLKYLMPL
ncbi:hypothetical protein [Fictibacillus barbaricus]|uniref:Lysylphosphatidylglycerol synthetase-like protein (DUF2156 family) n=1 Tax=Fictibacillus barbaricus TaxID=182136 RepID=A0ABU1U1Q9_9BACL|nr:hypothetical protein [Fictibacillus barbaricus]MDR7073394.1 lysylphosphatidylglycerol synthetase-like protein (DUF2156 family) [Fictibacillus barbaricus]